MSSVISGPKYVLLCWKANCSFSAWLQAPRRKESYKNCCWNCRVISYWRWLAAAAVKTSYELRPGEKFSAVNSKRVRCTSCHKKIDFWPSAQKLIFTTFKRANYFWSFPNHFQPILWLKIGYKRCVPGRSIRYRAENFRKGASIKDVRKIYPIFDPLPRIRRCPN